MEESDINTQPSHPRRQGYRSQGPLSALILVIALSIQFNLHKKYLIKETEQFPSHETQVALMERLQPFFLPEPLLRMTLGGLIPLYVDWSWIRVLTDDTLLRPPRAERTRLYHALIHVTEIDPAYFEAYSIGGSLLAIIRDDIYGALDLLLRGERFRTEKLQHEPKEVREFTWKNQWQIPYQISYIYLIELHDIPSAASYLTLASKLEGAPTFLKRLEEKLATKQGQFRVARNIVSAMLQTELNKDPNSRMTKELNERLMQVEIAELFWRSNDLLNQSVRSKNAQARNARFRQLQQEGKIPFYDPQGARIEFITTSGSPEGIITSATPRRGALGL